MEETVNIFSDYKHISVIVHVFSVIIGMGSALVSDILFNVYIRDRKINIHENKTLSTLSNVIWGSLFFIVLSGIAIFLSDQAKYMASDKFLLKMVIVGFVIINGYAFQRIVHPVLRKINFKDTNIHHKYVKLRKLSFVFGSISLISWLSAFVLGSIPSIPVSFFSGLAIYFGLCVFGAISSLVVEYHVTHSGK